MAGKIHEFLAADHARLDALLNKALAKSDAVDYEPYAQFRAGLLKHIAMEEKVVLPATRRHGPRNPSIAKRLRLDHGALAALLVPTPTPTILAAVRKILETHNALEEESGGFYEVCETLAADEIEDIVRHLKEMPEVTLARHVDGSQVMEAMHRAVSRAEHVVVEDEPGRTSR